MRKQYDNDPDASELGKTCDLCAADRPGEHTSGCPTLFIEPACVHESDAVAAVPLPRGCYRRSCNGVARAVAAALCKRADLGRQVFTKHMGAHDVRVAWKHYVVGYCEALDVDVDVVVQTVEMKDNETEGAERTA